MPLRLLYIGDIMGRPGRDVVKNVLPALRKKHAIDVVIAQAENVSHGKSMTLGHMRELQAAGVDGFSGGNHTIERRAALGLLDNPAEPVVAPINQPEVLPAWGVKVITTPKGKVAFGSVLGTIFPNLTGEGGNPLLAIDSMLSRYKLGEYSAIVINFHGDFSSEKRVFGYYVDGRATAVVGDHWHVPTADAMVLPGGTAHITDVGMCGTLHSSLGVSKEIIISRWRDGAKVRNDIAEGGPFQFNAVLITCDPATGLAASIRPIQMMLDSVY